MDDALFGMETELAVSAWKSQEAADDNDRERLIQDYLGHRDPKHTVHYTRVAGVRFEGLWKS